VPGGVQHVVVVIPEDADIDVAQHIGREYRHAFVKRRRVGAVRHFHFQHHDGDDDGDHAIGKRFQPSLRHCDLPRRTIAWVISPESWLDLPRPSTPCSRRCRKKDVDARDSAGMTAEG